MSTYSKKLTKKERPQVSFKYIEINQHLCMLDFYLKGKYGQEILIMLVRKHNVKLKCFIDDFYHPKYTSYLR
jgi:hypothetical protein